MIAGAFPGVAGHRDAQERLSTALAHGRLPHALVLAGPEGIGKARLATALAAALHCDQQRGVGCGQCRSCRRIAHGHHAGVELVGCEPDRRTIGVDTARELRTHLELAPFEGDAHVIILDPAEALTHEACNALLKTLEEPRPGVYFVLVTHALALLPATVLSRCSVVRLGRLSDEDVEVILRDAAPEASAEARRVAVDLAQGSAGTALRLVADEGLQQARVLFELAREAAGAGPARIFAGDRSPLWAALTAGGAGPETGRAARERATVLRALDLWALELRRELRAEITEGSERAARLAHHARTLLEVRDAVERNGNVRLWFEQALLRLGAPPR